MKYFGDSYFTRTKSDSEIVYQVHKTGSSKYLLFASVFTFLFGFGSIFGLSGYFGIALMLLGAFFVWASVTDARVRSEPQNIEISTKQFRFNKMSFDISDISGFNWNSGDINDNAHYVSTTRFNAHRQNSNVKVAAKNMTLFMKLEADSRPIKVVSSLTSETADDLMMAVIRDINASSESAGPKTS